MNTNHDYPPMRKSRVLASYVLLYAVYVVLSALALHAFGLTENSPWWAVAAVCIPISLVVWLVGARILRPWYRPAPKREQWTEDRL